MDRQNAVFHIGAHGKGITALNKDACRRTSPTYSRMALPFDQANFSDLFTSLILAIGSCT